MKMINNLYSPKLLQPINKFINSVQSFNIFGQNHQNNQNQNEQDTLDQQIVQIQIKTKDPSLKIQKKPKSLQENQNYSCLEKNVELNLNDFKLKSPKKIKRKKQTNNNQNNQIDNQQLCDNLTQFNLDTAQTQLIEKQNFLEKSHQQQQKSQLKYKKIKSISYITQDIEEQGKSKSQILQDLLLKEPFFHKYKINMSQYQTILEKVPCSINKKSNSAPKVPYVPKIKENYEYTLVLDIDKTIIYSDQLELKNGTDSYKTYFRPQLLEFLSEMSKCYEIIAFTAAQQEYADNILNYIDIKNQYFTHRLYKQHMRKKTVYNINTGEPKKIFVKDLQCLGRDLRKVIIVDDIAQNFKFQPHNGILIPEWKHDNPSDRRLLELKQFLKKVINNKIIFDKNFRIDCEKIFS